jgi:uncharacterized protein (UPF0332 family)
MMFEKALESLNAAELCFQQKMYNSTANRAYYAMFQAAIAALEQVGVRAAKGSWGHDTLQAVFADQLIRQRKLYPRHFASFLPNGFQTRQLADYGNEMLSQRKARTILRWAREFVKQVEEKQHGR